MPLINRPFIWLIGIYKSFISPWLGNNCRFTPTCSQYAAQCLMVYPLHKAIALSCWRILRCNPLCKGGYDPVVNPTTKETT